MIARKLLGAPRASSVFSPPLRQALAYTDQEKASEKNYLLSGRRIGVQSWGIAPKIREVDVFLRKRTKTGNKIREVHPEPLFWALNGRKAMSYNKKSPDGFKERLRILKRYFSLSGEVVDAALKKFPRKKVRRDDILDSLVAAITALQTANSSLNTIPAKRQLDKKGLPMEMVYCSFD